MTAVLLSLFAASLLTSPWTLPFLFHSLASLLGYYIHQKTLSRRETLFSHTKSDKQSQGIPKYTSEDGDWEKVEGIALNSAPNGGTPGKDWKGVVGFFHPFCNAGGGGERVLWAAILATQRRWPEAVCIVYTGDHDADKEQIIRRVQDRFNITLHPPTLHFLYLSTRHYVLASTYPHFTLLGQSLGSLILALDAFTLLVPDVFVDTMGYSFALWLCKILFPNVPTGAYVHYPTISTDMLQSLDSTGDQGVNAGTGRGFKGTLKKRYWHLFALLYSWTGATIDAVMTNSTWTQTHIRQLWGPKRPASASQITVVFPPVAVEELEVAIPVSAESEKARLSHILYIAQFRPEKNHTLIIHAFARLIRSRAWTSVTRPRLVLVGSVRDGDDKKRVYKLRLLVNELKIKEDVEFVCDAKWDAVLQHLGSASLGVNGMWNEHFGIGVVEYEAAGLISVVNDSGGPKEDIVVDIDGGRTGFHASTEEEYAAAFAEALDLSTEEKVAMRLRARQSARRFTEEVFAGKWIGQMETLVDLQTKLSPRPPG